jgi:hypothetical protein
MELILSITTPPATASAPWALTLPASSLHLGSTATSSWSSPSPPGAARSPPHRQCRGGTGRVGPPRRRRDGRSRRRRGERHRRGRRLSHNRHCHYRHRLLCRDRRRCLGSRRRHRRRCGGGGEGSGSSSISSSPSPSIQSEPSASPSSLTA